MRKEESFEKIPAGEAITAMLKVRPEDLVYEIRIIRLANDIPIALEWTYVSINLIQGLTADKVTQSLYSFIEKTIGLKIAAANQVIEANIACKDKALAFGYRGRVTSLAYPPKCFLGKWRPFGMGEVGLPKPIAINLLLI